MTRNTLPAPGIFRVYGGPNRQESIDADLQGQQNHYEAHKDLCRVGWFSIRRHRSPKEQTERRLDRKGKELEVSYDLCGGDCGKVRHEVGMGA